MKRIEEIERQVPDLETKFKRNKDLFNDNHEVKAVDSGPLTSIYFLSLLEKNKRKWKSSQKSWILQLCSCAVIQHSKTQYNSSLIFDVSCFWY